MNSTSSLSPRDYLTQSTRFLICTINRSSVPIRILYPNEFNFRWNWQWQLVGERSMTVIERNKSVISISSGFWYSFIFIISLIMFVWKAKQMFKKIYALWFFFIPDYQTVTVLVPIFFFFFVFSKESSFGWFQFFDRFILIWIKMLSF